MKLGRYSHNGEHFVGVLNQDGDIIKLGYGGDTIAALKDIATVKTAVAQAAVVVPAAECTVLSPITGCEKVLCIGMNYVDHCTEQDVAIPKEPVVFNKFASAIVNPGDDIEIFPECKKMDFEVEMVIVVGKAGKRISEADAMNHVFGYTVAHDVSARDWQLEENGGQWLLGKAFDTGCPLGPHIVTPEEFDAHNTGIRCFVNGQNVQDSSTNQLIFKTEYLIHWLSKFVTLNVGDIILTGTPPGVGCFRKPPMWLQAGDVVRCEIDGIGAIENRMVAVPEAKL
eukprot:TRINITY_DN19727_c0_g1_i1.p1 TRINITY_DN19727_c0_g1~~TRINITY_DN19727_c0_g1_i1.p1  ORF type:complete len:283 (+),score=86.75 TRINITY_DN19727_c0_g1_i1:214-1062(+)